MSLNECFHVRQSLGIDLSRSDLLDHGLELLAERLQEFAELVAAK